MQNNNKKKTVQAGPQERQQQQGQKKDDKSCDTCDQKGPHTHDKKKQSFEQPKKDYNKEANRNERGDRR